MDSSSQVEWSCPQREVTINERHRYCTNCETMLAWTCPESEKSGLYSNYFRHRQRRNYCAPKLEQEKQQLKGDRQNERMQDFQMLYNEQRPWFEWSLSNNSCIQHTGHDIEQVRQLYNLCEQSLIEYCANRKQRTTSTNIPYLSPINLLSVTLWYLKHYHSERYIATELSFGQKTVNYFLSAVIDILYSCICPKLVVLPDNMDDETTIHGPEQYHKLIVDSTFIAIEQPEDSEQRKAYYHEKVRQTMHSKESGLLEHTGEDVQIIADKRYIGEQYVITLKKKSRTGELTAEDKDFNRSISSYQNWYNFLVSYDDAQVTIISRPVANAILDTQTVGPLDYETNPDQMRIIFGLNSNQVHGYKYRLTIIFLELTEDNFNFAHFFWYNAIQKINIRDLTQSEIAYWGQRHKRRVMVGSEVNTFLQWFVLKRPCIPVQILSTNGINESRCLKSIQVYSNRLCLWIGHYLPIFECMLNAEAISDEWLKFFRFKTELSIDDYIYIVYQIYVRNPTGIDFEDDMRIQNIYTNLLQLLSNTNINQHQLYREKCQLTNICLLSECNSLFMPSEELNFWSIDTFQSPFELHILKLNVNNRQHRNLSHLLHPLICLAQNPSWTGYIYHYTHLENAVLILSDQTLKSGHFCQLNNFKDSSAYDFMSETDDQVNHYVRFYFRTGTSTQLNNENLGSNKSKKRNNYTPMCPASAFFCINLQAILNIPNLKWKVSISDMSGERTEYDCTMDIIKRFDFCGLFKDSENKRCKQLEFLIQNQLDFRLLPNDTINLVFQDSDAKQSLESILSTQIYNTETKRNYFFGKNNRIFINHDSQQDHISVMIDRETHHKSEIFIVQIKSHDNEQRIDLACKDNIDTVFHYDRITTVYGKEKRLNLFVGKQPYAVYYKYEKRL
ncbi:unnamed protein product [Rotaria sordida]|uniref:DarT domain-containing protein n=2 Tax=Rotaria sordida TaxID=392033 RepID=A0A816BKY8_9BILA|nr:unnamed protein product [Rotaria sordida]CAF1610536.1 unnamed protein product [Rotaria sordida]